MFLEYVLCALCVLLFLDYVPWIREKGNKHTHTRLEEDKAVKLVEF